MSSSQNVIDFRRRRKENLIKVCGSQCALCGYNKVVSALEFHHIIPETKEYGISEKGACHDLEKDFAEIKKCILVCANCHREIHEELYSIEELQEKQTFNEKYAKELLLDRNRKLGLLEKEKVYCSSCGKEITGEGFTGLCPTCVQLSRRICSRPSREELKQLIRTKPFTQIAQQYGVSDNAIRKWCDAERLPRKATEIKNYSDEEWSLI